MGSARSKRSAFSSRQKYWDRKEFGQTDDLRSLACCFANAFESFIKILSGIERTGELSQSDAECAVLTVGHTSIVTDETFGLMCGCWRKKFAQRVRCRVFLLDQGFLAAEDVVDDGGDIFHIESF